MFYLNGFCDIGENCKPVFFRRVYLDLKCQRALWKRALATGGIFTTTALLEMIGKMAYKFIA
jgi:hypothetical protein